MSNLKTVENEDNLDIAIGDYNIRNKYLLVMSDQGKESQSNASQPEWYVDGKIDEPMFCEQLIKDNSIKCINRVIYENGLEVSDDKVKNQIDKLISPFIKHHTMSLEKELLAKLKSTAYSDPIPPDENNIYFSNGVLNVIDGTFKPGCPFSFNRINYEYDETASKPEFWFRYLKDLLDEEDILTLQEFLGYLLIPTTKAQKVLFIIGNGGEGKSVIGFVLKQIFQTLMISASLKDLDEDKFMFATLVNKLVFLDDEMSVQTAKDSKALKELTTNSIPQSVNGKYEKRCSAQIYVRFLAFGNVPPSSIDHSEGMARREMILKVKPKPVNRVDDRFLTDKLAREIPGIINWLINGLLRLRNNNFEFTMSEQTKANSEEAQQEDCNIIGFLQNKDYVITHEPHSCISGQTIMRLYDHWCDENAEVPLPKKAVISYMKLNAERLGFRYSKNIPLPNGRNVRGFAGIKKILK